MMEHPGDLLIAHRHTLAFGMRYVQRRHLTIATVTAWSVRMRFMAPTDEQATGSTEAIWWVQ
jgi:hypothetical protein